MDLEKYKKHGITIHIKDNNEFSELPIYVILHNGKKITEDDFIEIHGMDDGEWGSLIPIEDAMDDLIECIMDDLKIKK